VTGPYDARREIRNAVTRMTGGLGDPRSSAHDPLKALETLMALRAAARDQMREAARRAREEGRSWHGIAGALGFADDPGPGMTSAAERAFGYLASDLGDGPSFCWTCPSCCRMVLDYGPETGPRESERGHADGCAGHAETIRSWDSWWDKGSSEGSGDDG
jgi:hypothetical protein